MRSFGTPIKVIENVTPDNIPVGVISAGEPVLFKGLVNEWPAVKASMSSDLAVANYIKQFYSGSPVVLFQCNREKGGRYFYNDDYKTLGFDSSRANMEQVLDALCDECVRHEGRNFYIGSTTVDTYLPGFRRENDVDLGERDPLVSIWMGNQSTVAAHFDAPDNLACCVAGKRVFTLFPIAQIDNLYVGPIDFTPAGQMISTVNFDDPDFDKHPKFKKAMDSAIIAELEPGDALYLPSMWWHHVQSYEALNILVNYWWRNAPSYMDAPLDTLFHAILTMRDLPEREKNAWKVIFNHFIFGEREAIANHLPIEGRGILNELDEGSARKLRMLLLNKLNR